MSKITLRETEDFSTKTTKSDKLFPSKNQIGSMPVINCTCGTKILLLPDLKAMNQAVENHIGKHNKLLQQRGEKKAPNNLIKEILVKGILKKASEKVLNFANTTNFDAR